MELFKDKEEAPSLCITSWKAFLLLQYTHSEIFNHIRTFHIISGINLHLDSVSTWNFAVLSLRNRNKREQIGRDWNTDCLPLWNLLLHPNSSSRFLQHCKNNIVSNLKVEHFLTFLKSKIAALNKTEPVARFRTHLLNILSGWSNFPFCKQSMYSGAVEVRQVRCQGCLHPFPLTHAEETLSRCLTNSDKIKQNITRRRVMASIHKLWLWHFPITCLPIQ